MKKKKVQQKPKNTITRKCVVCWRDFPVTRKNQHVCNRVDCKIERMHLQELHDTHQPIKCSVCGREMTKMSLYCSVNCSIVSILVKKGVINSNNLNYIIKAIELKQTKSAIKNSEKNSCTFIKRVL